MPAKKWVKSEKYPTQYTLGVDDGEKPMFTEEEIALIEKGYGILYEYRASRKSRADVEEYQKEIKPTPELTHSDNEFGGNWRLWSKGAVMTNLKKGGPVVKKGLGDKEVAEDRYEEMLGAVPPIYITTLDGVKIKGGFAVGEIYSHEMTSIGVKPIYNAFYKSGKEFLEIMDKVYFTGNGEAVRAIGTKAIHYKKGGSAKMTINIEQLSDSLGVKTPKPPKLKGYNKSVEPGKKSFEYSIGGL